MIFSLISSSQTYIAFYEGICVIVRLCVCVCFNQIICPSFEGPLLFSILFLSKLLYENNFLLLTQGN